MNRVHPEPISNLQRRVNIKIEEFPKPKLVRQTNEHERLPKKLLLRWWNSNADEKKNIWLEYELS